MNAFSPLKRATLLLVIGPLAACGGGGGGQMMTEDPTLGDMNVATTSDLVASVLDANAGTVTLETGELDRGDNSGSIGDLNGILSADRTRIALDDGGAVTFSGSLDTFAARFEAQTGTPTQGIVGIVTAASEIPNATATYAGDTVITAQNGTDLYELTGAASITATFGAANPRVTTVLSDLAGVRQPALEAPVTIDDAGTLTLSGSVIDGAQFTGGTAELTSDVLTLTGDETVDVAGAFYGPEGAEVGGVFAITDGDTTFFGDFLGN